MLLTCFKHDFKALSRTLVPALIGIAGAAVFGFLSALTFSLTEKSDAAQTGAALPGALNAAAVGSLIVDGMLLAAVMTVIVVLIFVRFYRSMVTDEAYLTFTLPVTAGQLIGAKFLASAVWFLIGSAALAIAGGLIYTGAILAGGGDFREAMVDLWQEVFELLAENPLTAFLLILCAVAAAVRWYFQITGAILFGASVVRKNKALAAVGMVFAVNFVVNLVTSFFPSLGLFALVFGFGGSYDFDMNIWLLVQTGISAILAAVFWWMSVRIAKKSVNIE